MKNSVNLAQPPKRFFGEISSFVLYTISIIPGIIFVAVIIGIIAVALNSIF